MAINLPKVKIYNTKISAPKLAPARLKFVSKARTGYPKSGGGKSGGAKIKLK